jgi:hypothetical protein
MSLDADLIRRAARYLIETHGSAAAAVAEKRATNVEAASDLATAAHLWPQIADNVREIQGGEGNA